MANRLSKVNHIDLFRSEGANQVGLNVVLFPSTRQVARDRLMALICHSDAVSHGGVSLDTHNEVRFAVSTLPGGS